MRQEGSLRVDNTEFVIITGLSGAGKSQAVKVFEDMGYFCVDNLPVPLIPKFAELCQQSGGKVQSVALVIDIRGDMFLDDLNNALAELTEIGIDYQILFLEASDEVLISRFKESRRNHPLSPEGTISAGIALERDKLTNLRGRANKVIDTSRLKVHELREELRQQWGINHVKMTVSILSFGYKHGIPMDTDLLMDVRFIPNPFYIPELRPLTGREAPVRDYVLGSAQSQIFLEKFSDLLLFLLPNYIKEGKTHLTLGIGCTGGQHRSVALAIRLGEILQQAGYNVVVKHRDS